MSHASPQQCPRCGGKLSALEALALNERDLWCDGCHTSHATPLAVGGDAWVLSSTSTPDLVHAWSWETRKEEGKPDIVWTRKIAEAAMLSKERAEIIHEALWNAGVSVEMFRAAELN